MIACFNFQTEMLQPVEGMGVSGPGDNVSSPGSAVGPSNMRAQMDREDQIVLDKLYQVRIPFRYFIELIA